MVRALASKLRAHWFNAVLVQTAQLKRMGTSQRVGEGKKAREMVWAPPSHKADPKKSEVFNTSITPNHLKRLGDDFDLFPHLRCH